LMTESPRLYHRHNGMRFFQILGEYQVSFYYLLSKVKVFST
jgi:hypothetical protein